MKRFFQHLLSLSAMLALALTATPADAKPGKKGPGFKKQSQSAKAVQSSKGHTGTHRGKSFGPKGHFDSRHRPLVKKAPPPPRRANMRPHMRRPGYVWIPGTWRFSDRYHRYVWVDGFWTRSRPHQRWVQGHWATTPIGWYFVSGYWM